MSLVFSRAQAKTNNELVNWNFIDVLIPLEKIKPGLVLRETIGPRLQNELREMDVVLLRSELAYQWNDSLNTSLGYDWFRRFNTDSIYENRFWEQVLLTKNLKEEKLYTRLRLEERFIQDTDMILRFRTKLGYIHKLSKTFSLDLSDEIFFNINRSEGIEQNRILLYLTKKINNNFTLSLGYQLQHFFMDKNLLNHAVMTRLQISL